MLEPYLHQVGGHCCVLRFGQQTICKPLIPREHQFYESVPAAVRKFTPQYRGVVSVSLEEDEEGNFCFVAYPVQSDPADDLENKDPSADDKPKCELLLWEKMMSSCPLVDGNDYSKGGRGRRSFKDRDEKSVQKLELEEEEEEEEAERSAGSAVPQLKHNPWTQQHCMQRIKDKAEQWNQYKFILLENLTWRHTLPCVLDLKMGTQQHGDGVPDDKKARKMRKCQQSTAAVLGVCLAGMQVSVEPRRGLKGQAHIWGNTSDAL
ncbi:Inositol hexakisphosphate kinase 2 [Liparis tanakae]|uniref:Kinase n=1 Tax=Liparis tanakae TaxID=230148 RepID=A0A4Z2G7Y8_9TELE|nr:Inositol hexakisphosphate kinase 2 [Liparis tanakae]